MLNSTHIPAHLYVSIISGHNTWFAPLLAVAGFIFGASITGGLSLYIEHYRLVKKKLATAYAFKGEISALLNIIKEKKYLEEFNKKINDINGYIEKLKTYSNPNEIAIQSGLTANLNVKDGIKEFQKAIIRELDIKPVKRLYFILNDDVFYVKKSLKNEIGLLDEAAEPVIKFYGFANTLLIDFNENKKFTEKLSSKLFEGAADKILENLYKYYEDYNVLGMAQKNLELHKNIRNIISEMINAGKKSVEELNKFIKKNELWHKSVINFFKGIFNHETKGDTAMSNTEDNNNASPDQHAGGDLPNQDDKKDGLADFISFLDEKYQRIFIIFSPFFAVMTSVLYLLGITHSDKLKTLSFGIMVSSGQLKYYVAAIAAIATLIIFFISIIIYQFNECLRSFWIKICKWKIPTKKDPLNAILYAIHEIPMVLLLFILVEILAFSKLEYLVGSVILITAITEFVIMALHKGKHEADEYYFFILAILFLLIFAVPLLLLQFELI